MTLSPFLIFTLTVQHCYLTYIYVFKCLLLSTNWKFLSSSIVFSRFVLWAIILCKLQNSNQRVFKSNCVILGSDQPQQHAFPSDWNRFHGIDLSPYNYLRSFLLFVLLFRFQLLFCLYWIPNILTFFLTSMWRKNPIGIDWHVYQKNLCNFTCFCLVILLSLVDNSHELVYFTCLMMLLVSR